jgi:hypothetical protein
LVGCEPQSRLGIAIVAMAAVAALYEHRPNLRLEVLNVVSGGQCIGGISSMRYCDQRREEAELASENYLDAAGCH